MKSRRISRASLRELGFDAESRRVRRSARAPLAARCPSGGTTPTDRRGAAAPSADPRTPQRRRLPSPSPVRPRSPRDRVPALARGAHAEVLGEEERAGVAIRHGLLGRLRRGVDVSAGAPLVIPLVRRSASKAVSAAPSAGSGTAVSPTVLVDVERACVLFRESDVLEVNRRRRQQIRSTNGHGRPQRAQRRIDDQGCALRRERREIEGSNQGSEIDRDTDRHGVTLAIRRSSRAGRPESKDYRTDFSLVAEAAALPKREMERVADRRRGSGVADAPDVDIWRTTPAESALQPPDGGADRQATRRRRVQPPQSVGLIATPVGADPSGRRYAATAAKPSA